MPRLGSTTSCAGCGQQLEWSLRGRSVALIESGTGAVHACPRRLVAAYLPPCPRCGEPVCRRADGTVEDRPGQLHACAAAKTLKISDWRPSFKVAS